MCCGFASPEAAPGVCFGRLNSPYRHRCDVPGYGGEACSPAQGMCLLSCSPWGNVHSDTWGKGAWGGGQAKKGIAKRVGLEFLVFPLPEGFVAAGEALHEHSTGRTSPPRVTITIFSFQRKISLNLCLSTLSR